MHLRVLIHIITTWVFKGEKLKKKTKPNKNMFYLEISSPQYAVSFYEIEENEVTFILVSFTIYVILMVVIVE